MVEPRHRYIRLQVPLLRQGNPNNGDSAVWCGRTSA